MKSLMATFVEMQLKKENLKDFLGHQNLGAQTGVKRSLNQPGYVIVWIFLQTDSFMMQWPGVLGTGFSIQVSQVKTTGWIQGILSLSSLSFSLPFSTRNFWGLSGKKYLLTTPHL